LIIKKLTYRTFITLLLCILQVAGIEVYAQQQTAKKDSIINQPNARRHRVTDNRELLQDSLVTDSLAKLNKKNISKIASPVNAELPALADTTKILPQAKIFIPNSTRALWLATIIPGGGQIYNRKYWKLPIIYGGFVGCAYALAFNNKYFKDYSQAYLDIMDSDPKTDSYLNFLAPNFDVTAKEDWLKKVLKQKKDSYRRYRDLSIFSFIGVYLISIIDAYVDAELSNFDISPDLGLRVEPAVINDRHGQGNSLGLQCSIKF